MATEDKDVLRLMISEDDFVAESKRRQLGFDEVLKKAMLHASASEAISWSVSDDSLRNTLSN